MPRMNHEVKIYVVDNNGKLGRLCLRRRFFMLKNAIKFSRVAVEQLNEQCHGLFQAVVS